MKQAPTARKRRGPDPAGRVDILAIRLLEKAVEVYGDIPLRGVYGTFKRDIDRTIKRNLGRFRLYVPPAPPPRIMPQTKTEGGPHAR